MKIEMTRTLPVTRKECFAALLDVAGWAEWTPFRLLDEDGRLAKAGDEVAIEYRTPLAFPVKGTATLDEMKEPELIRLSLAFPGLPAITETATLAASGTKAAMLTVELLAEEPDNWIGASLVAMLPLLLRADLRRTLDRLHDRLLPAAPKAA